MDRQIQLLRYDKAYEFAEMATPLGLRDLICAASNCTVIDDGLETTQIITNMGILWSTVHAQLDIYKMFAAKNPLFNQEIESKRTNYMSNIIKVNNAWSALKPNGAKSQLSALYTALYNDTNAMLHEMNPEKSGQSIAVRFTS